MMLTTLTQLVRKLFKFFERPPGSDTPLEHIIKQETSQLQKYDPQKNHIRDAAIVALTSLIGANEVKNVNHINRIQRYMLALALELQKHPRFQNFLTNENIELLFKLAPLHDIGEAALPADILQKPGKLSADELAIVREHVLLGSHAIATAEKELGEQGDFLNIAKQITANHHEKWDGSGYPRGLQNEDIPIPARLMALVDVYDALIHERSYKPALPHQEAIQVISNERNKHFDPAIVDAFLSIKDQFIEIANSFQDQAIAKA